MKVYGTSKIAVKATTINEAVLRHTMRQFHPGASSAEVDSAVQACMEELVEKVRRNATDGKNMLGGLVFPYEFPDAVNIHLQERRFPNIPFSGRFMVRREETVEHPIVQERFAEKDVLRARLQSATAAEDFDAVSDALRSLVDLHFTLLRRGVYAHDPLPDNYAFDAQGKLLMHDLGGISLDKAHVLKVMKRGQIGAMETATVRRNNYHAYRNLVSPIRQHEKIKASLSALARQMIDLQDPRVLSREFGLMRRGAVVVPDIRF